MPTRGQCTYDEMHNQNEPQTSHSILKQRLLLAFTIVRSIAVSLLKSSFVMHSMGKKLGENLDWRFCSCSVLLQLRKLLEKTEILQLKVFSMVAWALRSREIIYTVPSLSCFFLISFSCLWLFNRLRSCQWQNYGWFKSGMQTCLLVVSFYERQRTQVIGRRKTRSDQITIFMFALLLSFLHFYFRFLCTVLWNQCLKNSADNQNSLPVYLELCRLV